MRQDLDRELGITLIETLVALFIMALASSMIILTMPERPGPLEVASDKLANLAERAQQTALVSGIWTGVIETDQSYQIVMFRDGVWLPISQRPVKIDGDLYSEDDRERADGEPVLKFGPTGTADPIRLYLSLEGQEREFKVEFNGQMTPGQNS